MQFNGHGHVVHGLRLLWVYHKSRTRYNYYYLSSSIFKQIESVPICFLLTTVDWSSAPDVMNVSVLMDYGSLVLEQSWELYSQQRKINLTSNIRSHGLTERDFSCGCVAYDLRSVLNDCKKQGKWCAEEITSSINFDLRLFTWIIRKPSIKVWNSYASIVLRVFHCQQFVPRISTTTLVLFAHSTFHVESVIYSAELYWFYCSPAHHGYL